MTLFQELDKDRSGSISRLEFKRGMQLLGIPGTEKQLDELIQELDTDGDGDINYQEMAVGRAKHAQAVRRASREASSSALPPMGEEEDNSIPHLTLDWDEFATLVVHCHYTTRP